MPNSIQQRRDAILSRLYQDGRVEVSDLSSRMDVSEATIRRDLHTLAEMGLLEMSHGGATVLRNSDYSFISKSLRQSEEKQSIGNLAAEMVGDGDQVFLDSGTTCFEMARFLRSRKGLSVIVNSSRMAQELVAPGLSVIQLGGQYRPDRMDTVGPLAHAILERLRGYRAFFGSDGLGMDFGPTSIDIESASVFGLAVQNAREAWLLADTSKFDAPALYGICKWSAVTGIITNTPPSEQWQAFLRKNNIVLKVPEAVATDEESSALHSSSNVPGV